MVNPRHYNFAVIAQFDHQLKYVASVNHKDSTCYFYHVLHKFVTNAQNS